MKSQDPDREEFKRRVNDILRTVDEEVKKKDYDKALLIVRGVYSLDVANMYARAYEERILALKLEEDRDNLARDLERKAQEKMDVELKRRMNDFYRSMQLEDLKKKERQVNEQNLENSARRASVAEHEEIMRKDITEIERGLRKSIEEIEQKTALQGRQIISKLMMPGDRGTMSVSQVRADSVSAIDQIQQLYHEASATQRAAREEGFARMAEESQRSREELIRQMDDERETLMTREKENARELMQQSFQALLGSMQELGIALPLREPLLRALTVPFSISEEEYFKLMRNARLSQYVSALRDAWTKGKPSEEEIINLKSLQTLYGLSDNEHLALTRSAKKELGLPDEDAVILVVDDEPAVQKYVGHILRQTYHDVFVATTVDEALRVAGEHRPSLILSDLHLGPDSISGVTFYEKIRGSEYGETLRGVPFVLMSALRDEFFVKSAKNLGIRTFLPKPLTRESLERTVKEALN